MNEGAEIKVIEWISLRDESGPMEVRVTDRGQDTYEDKMEEVKKREKSAWEEVEREH